LRLTGKNLVKHCTLVYLTGTNRSVALVHPPIRILGLLANVEETSDALVSQITAADAADFTRAD
jgi:hypothetical protein